MFLLWIRSFTFLYLFSLSYTCIYFQFIVYTFLTFYYIYISIHILLIFHCFWEYIFLFMLSGHVTIVPEKLENLFCLGLNDSAPAADAFGSSAAMRWAGLSSGGVLAPSIPLILLPVAARRLRVGRWQTDAGRKESQHTLTYTHEWVQLTSCHQTLGLNMFQLFCRRTSRRLMWSRSRGSPD